MYSLQYDPLVVKDDFKKIPKSGLRRILKAIEQKLAYAPDRYGKPLRGSLKSYWKLRVGDYRVVYRIEKKKVVVYILHIGARKDEQVYVEALKRRL